MTSTRESSASRRERILHAAIDAFARTGFHGASTREIAVLAGVTDALLFYHFKSKADLYRAAVIDQLEKLREGLERDGGGIPAVCDRLRSFVSVYLAYFLDIEPGLTVTLRELQGIPKEAAEAITIFHHTAVTARLEEILRDGMETRVFRPLDVQTCALAIIGILQIFIRVEARVPGSIPRTAAIEQVMEHYLPGLLRAPRTRRLATRHSAV